jgi:hypothetical protein
MSTRTSSALATALLLAACGAGGEESGAGDARASSAAKAARDDRVACALAGAQVFTQDCTLERARVDGAPILVVRHPDGSFRRFAIKDGSLTEADGADKASVSRSEDVFDVSVGSDRYRLSTKQIADGR